MICLIAHEMRIIARSLALLVTAQAAALIQRTPKAWASTAMFGQLFMDSVALVAPFAMLTAAMSHMTRRMISVRNDGKPFVRDALFQKLVVDPLENLLCRHMERLVSLPRGSVTVMYTRIRDKLNPDRKGESA